MCDLDICLRFYHISCNMINDCTYYTFFLTTTNITRIKEFFYLFTFYSYHFYILYQGGWSTENSFTCQFSWHQAFLYAAVKCWGVERRCEIIERYISSFCIVKIYLILCCNAGNSFLSQNHAFFYTKKNLQGVSANATNCRVI